MGHYRQPVGNTCPKIDKVLSRLSRISVFYKVNGKENKKELVDTIEAIHEELSGIDSILEDLRDANSDLREWGIREAERVDELETKLAEALI